MGKCECLNQELFCMPLLNFSVLKEQRSAYYNERQHHLTHLITPTISEAKCELNSPLAEVVFDQCPKALRTIFGLEPELCGPPATLWVSPSDVLLTQVKLKPPITQKCLQALTHQGILEIGGKIEQRTRKVLETEKYRALREQESRLIRLFDIKKERAVERVKREAYEAKLQEIERISVEFEWWLKEILDSVCILMERHQIELMQQKECFEQRVVDIVEEVTSSIAAKFLEKLEKQKEILLATFQAEYRRLHFESKIALKAESKRCEQKMEQLRRSSECQNIANLIYILCKERRKCHLEKLMITNMYDSKLEKLQAEMGEQDAEIQQLRQRYFDQCRSVDRKAAILVEVMKQFQKFIMYALKASPTQGEFLLSLEQVLQDFMREPDAADVPDKPRNSSTQTAPLPPPPVPELTASLSSTIKPTHSFMDGIEVPALDYRNHIYVRQEVRDLLSPDMRAKCEHRWCQGIEELLLTMRLHAFDGDFITQDDSSTATGSSKDRCAKEGNNIKCMITRTSGEDASVTAIPLKKSSNSNVHFESKRASLYSKGTTESPRPSLKSTSFTSGVMHDAVGYVEKSRTLLATEDSLDVIRERSRMSQTNMSGAVPSASGSKTSDELPEGKRSIASDYNSTFNANETASQPPSKPPIKDSVVLHRAAKELKSLEALAQQQQQTPTTAVPTTSKLMLACDSLELLRSSVSRLSVSARRLPMTTDPVSVSHIDNTDDDNRSRMSRVSFHQRKAVINKNYLKILGDPEAKEGVLLSDKEFTNQRIRSLLHLIRNNPSLVNLFTSCLR